MNALTIKKALAGVAIAASSIGFMAAPAFASKNTGGYQRSGEAHKADAGTCDTLYTDFANQVNRAGDAYNSGDKATMNQALDWAKGDLDSAKSAGCDWAARVVVPTYTVPGAVQVAHPVRAVR